MMIDGHSIFFKSKSYVLSSIRYIDYTRKARFICDTKISERLPKSTKIKSAQYCPEVF